MITVLAGNNRFLVKQAVEEAIESFVTKHGDLGLERVDAEEASFERLKESLVGLPFLADKKLVVMTSIETNKELLENFEHIINAVPESTDVILVISKLDKRAKYYKFLQKNTEFIEYGDQDEQSLSRWLVEQAKKAGGTLSTQDSSYMIQRLGTNQAILAKELDKLMLFNPGITRESIDQQTEAQPQSTVFELMDAAFAGNHKKALKLYDEQRKLKVEPLAILGMIAWQLHILAIVATAKDKQPGEVAKEAKIHPFVVNKSKGLLQHLGYPKLKELISHALELDVRLKSQAMEPDDALKHFLLSI
jgi:DNA polymerase-3 subunit delta